ncbi:hypothetical protein CSQ93_22900 [Janthinobacterium sp. BJB426]|uniref:hypothetical protein n=1 Tax=Janthinobacterium sp. BJB426 TaxID=2048010 RepID=UPI000C1108BF|nr:hypothetical protein [Janthinobacterium sp. BJB426]PHV25605.1 hypothetical protein CSQ93_22900 [Janthinobacterium sp. BJB426]
MQLKEVMSVDDLRKLGSVEIIKMELEKEISPLKIEASSYDEIFEIILKLRRNWVPFIRGPFISKQLEYAYYLTKLEGKQRTLALGVDERHYHDKQFAKRWYKKIANIVHPDKGGDNLAFTELRKLYDVMIEDDGAGND